MAILYRGVALDPATADADRQAIGETGRLAAKSFWRNTMASPAEVRRMAAGLAASPAGARDAIDALPQTPLTYACARFDDAAFYARREKGIPFVISFEVPLEQVAIDGKDFLYTVFQFWDQNGDSHREQVRGKLAALFGPAILPWFDLAGKEREQQARIGLCDLATFDLSAIEAHHANRIGILGRHGTRFRSAFALPEQIDPASVLAVEDVAGSLDPPDEVVDLRDVLKP